MDKSDSQGDPAFTLAGHVTDARFADIPADAIDAAKRDLLDTFGVMLGGSGAPGIAELARVTGRWGGLEESSLVVLGGKMPAHHAALVNSAMGHALDFDDTLDAGGNIHPGTSVLAASLALAEARGPAVSAIRSLRAAASFHFPARLRRMASASSLSTNRVSGRCAPASVAMIAVSTMSTASRIVPSMVVSSHAL